MRKNISGIAVGLALGLAGTGAFVLASEDLSPPPTAMLELTATSTAAPAVTPTPTGTVIPTATPTVASLEGTVVSVSADGTITVAVDGTTYTVTVGLATQFEPSGTTLGTLDPGDVVEIEGTVSGTVVVASKVELEGEDVDCQEEEESSHGECVSQTAHQAHEELEPGRERGQLVSCVARGEEDCYIQVDDGRPAGAESDDDSPLPDASRETREDEHAALQDRDASPQVQGDGSPSRDRDVSQQDREDHRGDGKERRSERDKDRGERN